MTGSDGRTLNIEPNVSEALAGVLDPTPLRIIQVVGTLDIEVSGVTYTVRRLSDELAARGTEVSIMAVGKPRQYNEGGACSVQAFPRDLNAIPVLKNLYLSRQLYAALGKAAPGALLHTNGLWSMPTVYPASHARRLNVPLVLSPHGMLGDAALNFSTGKKRIFSAAVQSHALQAVTCFHATSFEELKDIRLFGLEAPVAVIPNGIDVPTDEQNYRQHHKSRTFLYLGRLHPQKGLDRLIKAWSQLELSHPDWSIRIIGPSEIGYREELEALTLSLGLQRISFEDAIFGQDKEAAYGSADVFVLPTLNENFGLVVGEALAAGTPVITTKGAPWSGLVENGCGWWIDHGVDPLVAALTEATALPRDRLEKMGAKGHLWMARDFAWSRIAADMIDVYSWCAGMGDKPSCVVVER